VPCLMWHCYFTGAGFFSLGLAWVLLALGAGSWGGPVEQGLVRIHEVWKLMWLSAADAEGGRQVSFRQQMDQVSTGCKESI
jgi:hypothetical protein